jgi:hypothetical protein
LYHILIKSSAVFEAFRSKLQRIFDPQGMIMSPFARLPAASEGVCARCRIHPLQFAAPQKGQNSNQLVHNSPIGRVMAFRLNFLSCCFKKVSHKFPAWHILCYYFSLNSKRSRWEVPNLNPETFQTTTFKGDKAMRKTISFITFSIFLIVTPFVFAQGAPGEGLERKGESVEKRANTLEKRGERVERRGEGLEKEGEQGIKSIFAIIK